MLTGDSSADVERPVLNHVDLRWILSAAAQNISAALQAPSKVSAAR